LTQIEDRHNLGSKEVGETEVGVDVYKEWGAAGAFGQKTKGTSTKPSSGETIRNPRTA